MALNLKHLCCHVALLTVPFTTVALAQEIAPAEQGTTAQEEPKKGTVGGFFQSLSGTLNGAMKKITDTGKGATGNAATQDAAGSATAGGATATAAGTKAAQGKALPASIRTTPLAGLFAKYPYDGTAKSNYPRVAVTLTDWSRNDCWVAQATIWKSKTKSEPVAPFSVCLNDSFGFALNNAANLHLFQEQSAIEHSGNIRSTGPKPPMMATPMQLPFGETKYSAYHGFIQQLVVDTGWQPGAPTNIWLVGFGADSAMKASASDDRESAADSPAAAPAAVGQAVVGAQCKAGNFTQETYNRIQVGMTFDAVKRAIGCEPDPDFTRRSDSNVYYMWAVTINNLVAAKSIEVFFDPSGEKVKALGKSFKFAKGF